MAASADGAPSHDRAGLGTGQCPQSEGSRRRPSHRRRYGPQRDENRTGRSDFGFFQLRTLRLRLTGVAASRTRKGRLRSIAWQLWMLWRRRRSVRCPGCEVSRDLVRESASGSCAASDANCRQVAPPRGAPPMTWPTNLNHGFLQLTKLGGATLARLGRIYLRFTRNRESIPRHGHCRNSSSA